MFQVSKLSHLKILNLAGNSIVTMEGLKELKLLTWLSLASNSIKVRLCGCGKFCSCLTFLFPRASSP